MIAIVAASALGANAVIPAVAERHILVRGYTLMAAGAVNAKFQSASKDISGLKYFSAAGAGISVGEGRWFQTEKGEALNLYLSGAVAVGGEIYYELIL